MQTPKRSRFCILTKREIYPLFSTSRSFRASLYCNPGQIIVIVHLHYNHEQMIDLFIFIQILLCPALSKISSLRDLFAVFPSVQVCEDNIQWISVTNGIWTLWQNNYIEMQLHAISAIPSLKAAKGGKYTEYRADSSIIIRLQMAGHSPQQLRLITCLQGALAPMTDVTITA